MSCNEFYLLFELCSFQLINWRSELNLLIYQIMKTSLVCGENWSSDCVLNITAPASEDYPEMRQLSRNVNELDGSSQQNIIIVFFLIVDCGPITTQQLVNRLQ